MVHDSLTVALDCVNGNVEPEPDVFVAHFTMDKYYDFEFPGGEANCLENIHALPFLSRRLSSMSTGLYNP